MQRLGVLFDLWDQSGTPLQQRRRQYEHIQDLGLGSLRSLSALRAAVLEVATPPTPRPHFERLNCGEVSEALVRFVRVLISSR